MSHYFDKLDADVKKRYCSKLVSVGLNNIEKEDPFLWHSDRYTDDFTSWPNLNFAHIYCYYIETLGLYTHGELEAYKSRDAFNFVQSGCVHTICQKKREHGHVLKAKFWDLGPQMTALIKIGSQLTMTAAFSASNLVLVIVKNTIEICSKYLVFIKFVFSVFKYMLGC